MHKCNKKQPKWIIIYLKEKKVKVIFAHIFENNQVSVFLMI